MHLLQQGLRQDKSTAWISIRTVMCRTKRTWGDLAAVKLEIDTWVRPLSRNSTSPADSSIHRKALTREAARGAIWANIATPLHTMDGQCIFPVWVKATASQQDVFASNPSRMWNPWIRLKSEPFLGVNLQSFGEPRIVWPGINDS